MTCMPSFHLELFDFVHQGFASYTADTGNETLLRCIPLLTLELPKFKVKLLLSLCYNGFALARIQLQIIRTNLEDKSETSIIFTNLDILLILNNLH